MERRGSHPRRPSRLGELRQQVDRAVLARRSLDWIDAHIIALADVSDERRAALWIYAFARVPRAAQEQLAAESLASVAD